MSLGALLRPPPEDTPAPGMQLGALSCYTNRQTPATWPLAVSAGRVEKASAPPGDNREETCFTALLEPIPGDPRMERDVLVSVCMIVTQTLDLNSA